MKLAAATVNGKIYAIAAPGTGVFYPPTVEVYDPVANQLEHQPLPP